MIDWGLLILLLAAIAIGFYIGRRSVRQSKQSQRSDYPSLERHYIQGLNYLLNERQDAAIDTFIDALDVNSETLETHLALGNLLRKRGEVDRAIKIHQNLLARPGLAEEHSMQVQLELATDFIKAGLLDRAELLLTELIDVAHNPMRSQCLEYLIEIYRDEKEWLKGIGAINQLVGRRFSRGKESWRLVQSHFYCELAEEAIQRSDYLSARRQLKSAMAVDKRSARASLLLGKLDLRLGQYREALRAYKLVHEQDPSLLGEALPPIEECYRQLGQISQFKPYLQSILDQGSSIAGVISMAEQIATEQDEVAAAKYLSGQAVTSSSLLVARKMLVYQLRKPSSASDGMVMAETVLHKLQQSIPQYRCLQCGFGGQYLHWLCPSCKTWGSVKPVE